MSLINTTIPPRFIDVVNVNEEIKKQVRVFVGNISEKEALLMFEDDIDKNHTASLFDLQSLHPGVSRSNFYFFSQSLFEFEHKL